MAFKIAVIGCGWVSTACHGPAYLEYVRSHPGVVLGGCCDVDGQRAEQFRGQFGFQHAYTDYLDMLEQEQPQAVALNVPPQYISAVGCDILRRGYPLLSEKPPGLTVEEVDRLIAAAQSSGTIHQVAFNRRFMPLMQQLQLMLKRLTQQVPGPAIFHLEAQMARVRRLEPTFNTTAVHAIDAARFLADSDYTQASITYQELPHLGAGVANMQVDAHFANGSTAHLVFSPVSGVNIERYTVYALGHTFFLQANNGPDAPGRLQHYQDGQLVQEMDAAHMTGRREEAFLNGFYAEDAAFFDAVQAGRQPIHDFTSCRPSIEMMQYLAERRTQFP